MIDSIALTWDPYTGEAAWLVVTIWLARPHLVLWCCGDGGELVWVPEFYEIRDRVDVQLPVDTVGWSSSHEPMQPGDLIFYEVRAMREGGCLSE